METEALKPSLQALDGIQVLRWFAASSVILAHTDISSFVSNPGALGFFGVGVDIFFSISGFIMMLLLETRRDCASVFLARRFSRIFPLYFISTLVVCGLAYALSIGYVPDSVIYFYPPQKMDIDWFIESVLFFGLNRPPINGIGWSLQFEVMFYICLSILLFLRIDRKIIGFVVFFCFGYILKALGSNLSIFWHPFFIEFLFGMVTFHFWRLGFFENLTWATFSAVLFITGVCLWKMHYFPAVSAELWRVLTAGLAGMAALIFALVVAGRFRIPKIFVAFGDSSYALYLTHWVFMPLVCGLILPWFNGSSILYCGTVFIIFQIMSFSVYRFVDKPAHEFVLSWFVTRLSSVRT